MTTTLCPFSGGRPYPLPATRRGRTHRPAPPPPKGAHHDYPGSDRRDPATRTTDPLRSATRLVRRHPRRPGSLADRRPDHDGPEPRAGRPVSGLRALGQPDPMGVTLFSCKKCTVSHYIRSFMPDALAQEHSGTSFGDLFALCRRITTSTLFRIRVKLVPESVFWYEFGT